MQHPARLIRIAVGCALFTAAVAGPLRLPRRAVAAVNYASFEVNTPAAPTATTTFSINANGAKEVTSSGTPNQGDLDGTAVGTIRFDNGTGAGTTGSATINLTLTNLDVATIDLTGHHIHQAPSTTTGPIVIDFGDPDTIRSGNTLSGTITGLPAATITALMSNPSGFYYNLHNAQFTGGAVRDQLVAAPGPGAIVISEFRLSGPGGANDKFVELHNRTGADLSISGHHLFLLRSDGSVSEPQIPAGAVVPARGHFLIALSAYSLAAYAPPDVADPVDRSTYISGVGLFNQTLPDPSTRIDAVRFSDAPAAPGNFASGFTEGNPLAQTGATTAENSWVRKSGSGVPQDTDDNLNDFVLVSTTGAALGGVQSALGAPGPQNLSGPAARNQLKASLLDPAVSSSAPPNRERNSTVVTNGALGTLRIRRAFRNTTGGDVTALRFRVLDITTLNSPGYAPGNGQADLRVVASGAGDFSVAIAGGGVVPVKGTQPEQPPAQPNGGGLNTSVVTLTPAAPIPAGQSVNVEFTLGVQQGGTFRFFINVEALPGTAASPSAMRPGKVGSRAPAKR